MFVFIDAADLHDEGGLLNNNITPMSSFHELGELAPNPFARDQFLPNLLAPDQLATDQDPEPEELIKFLMNLRPCPDTRACHAYSGRTKPNEEKTIQKTICGGGQVKTR